MSMDGRYAARSQEGGAVMSKDGRYAAKSQGWRCGECPRMDGMPQKARDGGAANVHGWSVLGQPGIIVEELPFAN